MLVCLGVVGGDDTRPLFDVSFGEFGGVSATLPFILGERCWLDSAFGIFGFDSVFDIFGIDSVFGIFGLDSVLGIFDSDLDGEVSVGGSTCAVVT